MAIVKMIASKPRLFALRLAGLVLAGLLLSGQAPVAEAQQITFPHKNEPDLRGILNAFNAFKQACIAQPVTPDLPEKLVPEGYQVVTFDLFYWGEDNANLKDTFVLTKTGSEERDVAGGQPYVLLKMPTEDRPDGDCEVRWKRSWDEADYADAVIPSTSALLNSWVSFHLQAILISRPDDTFMTSENIAEVSDWVTICWETEFCNFGVFSLLDTDDGIDLRIRRDGRLVTDPTFQ